MSTGEGKPAPSQTRLQTDADRDAHESVSARVVEAIATATETDPMSAQFCLHDHLDPDALDALIASRETDLSITFTIDGHTVTVDADGTVTIAD